MSIPLANSLQEELVELLRLQTFLGDQRLFIQAPHVLLDFGSLVFAKEKKTKKRNLPEWW